MAKISKNARTDRGKFSGEKNLVKVVKAFKSSKSGSVAFKEKVMHQAKVNDFLAE